VFLCHSNSFDNFLVFSVITSGSTERRKRSRLRLSGSSCRTLRFSVIGVVKKPLTKIREIAILLSEAMILCRCIGRTIISKAESNALMNLVVECQRNTYSTRAEHFSSLLAISNSRASAPLSNGHAKSTTKIPRPIPMLRRAEVLARLLCVRKTHLLDRNPRNKNSVIYRKKI